VAIGVSVLGTSDGVLGISGTDALPVVFTRDYFGVIRTGSVASRVRGAV